MSFKDIKDDAEFKSWGEGIDAKLNDAATVEQIKTVTDEINTKLEGMKADFGRRQLPIDGEAKRHGEMREQRKTRVQPSQRNRRKPRPKRQPADHYTKQSYSRAVRRSIDKANKGGVEPQLPHWHPNQLRHSAATEIRRAYGLEAAQVVLGHSKADITQVYAERDFALAADVMRRIG